MNVHSIEVLYFDCNAASGLDGIQDLLGNAGINARMTLFDRWINDETDENVDALILLIDPSCCTNHSIYTVLDMGLPVLMLSCFDQVQLPGDLPQCYEVLSFPKDNNNLLDRIHKLTRQSSYVPLRIPAIKGMEQLNSLSIYGVSASFIKVIAELRQFSRSQAPILIEGETGTGKELGARALHYLGPRREGPFIPVNCSSLPDSLFENEVFGHSRGAYTDAKDNYSGLVGQAEGGTLFLDEVDSLQSRAQASLLRYLQDKKYRPLGSAKFVTGQTSIVAATNQDLNTLVSEGRFRQDLLYRINTITITFPPLRERPEDISLLARVFLRRLSEQYGQAPKSFHPDTLEWLEKQHWPGNVRQLENCIHREFLLSKNSFVQINNEKRDDSAADRTYVYLPNSITDYRFNEIRDIVVRDFEQQYLHHLMLTTHGNVSKAARLADKERRCLGKLLKKHGINREDYIREIQ